MRRAMGTILGISALLAMTGAAYASASHTATTTAKPAANGASVADVGMLRAAAANGPETVGTAVNVSKSLGYAGGARTMTLHYPGASYVKVHFSRLLMMPGDSLTIANARGTESYT
jgi:lysyl endopeptidase